MGKKALDFSSLWAQQIYRYQDPKGDEFIAALVFKKFSESDVEMKHPEYVGITKQEVRDMITDNDPDSETFTKRIPDQRGEVVRTVWKFTDKATPEMLEKYKKLAGSTNAGITSLIWKFREGAHTCREADVFWATPMKEVYQQYVLNRSPMVKKRVKKEE